jgi:hypothetical protein
MPKGFESTNAYAGLSASGRRQAVMHPTGVASAAARTDQKIGQHQRERLALEPRDRRGRIVGHGDCEALLLEDLADQIGRLCVVIENQYPVPPYRRPCLRPHRLLISRRRKRKVRSSAESGAAHENW